MANINGGAGNDNLTGLAGDDVIKGLGGNDNLTDTTGNDSMDGAGGNDNLTGGWIRASEAARARANSPRICVVLMTPPRPASLVSTLNDRHASSSFVFSVTRQPLDFGKPFPHTHEVNRLSAYGSRLRASGLIS